MRMPSIGITCYASQGGSGVVATELGLHLSRRGCEVHFISSELPFRLRKYHDNIFYHPVEMPHYPVFQHSPYTLTLATAMSEVAGRLAIQKGAQCLEAGAGGRGQRRRLQPLRGGGGRRGLRLRSGRCRRRSRLQRLRQADQPVSLAGHGRHHHHHVIATVAPLLDLARHVLDALDGAYRGTTVFLNYQCHWVEEFGVDACENRGLNYKTRPD